MTNIARYGKMLSILTDKKYYKKFMSEEDAHDWEKNIAVNGQRDTMKPWPMPREWYFRMICLMLRWNITVEKNYAEINEFLRTGKITSIVLIDYGTDCDTKKSVLNIEDEQRYRCEAIVDLLKLVLCSAPRIPENIVVYRLVSNKVIQKIIRKNKQGQKEYLERSFLSTSLVKSALSDDINCSNYTTEDNLLKIYVPEGIIGAYVNDAVERSEEELLFLPGMNLRLIEYP